MQLKTIQPMHVLCFETETTMEDLLQYVRVVASRLYKDAVKYDLEITGPVYWLYEGADGQPGTRFMLTIALPITASDQVLTGSEFRIQTVDTFYCISEQHTGNWMLLGETYGKLIAEIQSKNFQMSGLTREIYLNMDFQNPEANITEVQIGLVK